MNKPLSKNLQNIDMNETVSSAEVEENLFKNMCPNSNLQTKKDVMEAK